MTAPQRATSSTPGTLPALHHPTPVAPLNGGLPSISSLSSTSSSSILPPLPSSSSTSDTVGSSAALTSATTTTTTSSTGGTSLGKEITPKLEPFDPESVTRDLKKEGSDWITMFNPNVKRVLDVGLVHTLVHDS